MQPEQVLYEFSINAKLTTNQIQGIDDEATWGIHTRLGSQETYAC